MKQTLIGFRKLYIAAAMLLASLALLSACGELAVTGSTQDNDRQWIESVTRKYKDLNASSAHIEQVGRVIDGDTFDTADGDRVRLIGVNTPEIRPVEHFGKEASAFAKQQLEGKRVLMFADAGNKDRYGRLLRYVFIEGQELMFNELLVQEGYANTMTIAPNVTFADNFVVLEREAREQERGLWKEAGKAEKAGKTDKTSKSDKSSKSETSGGKSGSAEAPASNACKEPKIKGNINSKGEKIYHKPGGASYEQTVAEEMFCTEQEAEQAGFRAAKR